MISFFYSLDIRIYFLFFIVIFLILSRLVIYLQGKPITMEQAKQYTDKLVIFIDKYYINNIYCTLTCVIMYFFANISIIVFLRIKTMQKTREIQEILPLELTNVKMSFFDILNIFSYGFLFLCTLVCYKVFVDILFFKEILKMHIFLSSTKYYDKIWSIFIGHYLTDFLGALCLFFHNVHKLRPLSNLAEKIDYHDFNLYNDIYENMKIQRISFFCVNLAKKHYFIYLLFYLLKKIFLWLYKHIDFYEGFLFKIPYLLFLLILLHDIVHLNFYYTGYNIFPLYVFNLIHQYVKFLHKKSILYDNILSRYFYENTLDYRIQRKIMKTDKTSYLKIMFESEENRAFYNILTEKLLVKYILNDLKDVIVMENIEKHKQMLKHLKSLYIRYIFNIVYTTILVYLTFNIEKNPIIFTYWNIKFPIVYILWPLFIMTFYFSVNIFKYKDELHYDFEDYVYDSKSNRIFIVLAIIQIYLVWLLIIKAHLVLIEDNVLYDHIGIKIMNYYTIKQQSDFLDKYLELCMVVTNMDLQHKENIKLFLLELGMENIITENTTIKDIKVFVEGLIQNYIYSYEKYINKLEKYINRLERIYYIKNCIMYCVKNMINVITLWKFFVKYVDAWYLIKNLDSPRTLTLTEFIIDQIIKMMKRKK